MAILCSGIMTSMVLNLYEDFFLNICKSYKQFVVLLVNIFDSFLITFPIESCTESKQSIIEGILT